MSKSRKTIKGARISPQQVVEQAAEVVEEAPKKKSFLAGLAEKVAPVAKVVIPQVAGLIPGVGPILKGVLSTLNDDEWFSEFKSGGATFNELLGDIPMCPGSDKVRNVTGALLIHEVSILGEGNTSMVQKYSDMLLPTLLAYVRDKTGDVLVSAEADYWDAFFQSSCLIALYYTLEKYIELQHDLPLNIPDLSSICKVLSPADYAAYVGIRDSLRDYLRVTIGLPYAWTEYLRWRFGTTFYSDNTGRAGLIMYDYNLRFILANPGSSWVKSALTPATLAAKIATFKAALAATSRAVADLHLAFKDHAVRYNVETRHYDEKEFNLRCNVFNYAASLYKTGVYGQDLATIPALPGPMVYLDSRLDSSAAYQAVTISTDTDSIVAPLHVTGQNAYWYNKAAYDIDYGYVDANNQTQADIVTVPAGWHSANTWDEATTDSKARSAKLFNVAAEWVNGPNKWRAYTTERYWGTYLTSSGSTDADRRATVLAALDFQMSQLVQDSLQGHKGQSVMQYAPSFGVNPLKIFVGKPLAYDMAIVTWSQIESTQRMAMRNLIRGNYTHKISPATNPVVTEPVNELVEVVADEMVKGAEEISK